MTKTSEKTSGSFREIYTLQRQTQQEGLKLTACFCVPTLVRLVTSILPNVIRKATGKFDRRKNHAHWNMILFLLRGIRQTQNQSAAPNRGSLLNRADGGGGTVSVRAAASLFHQMHPHRVSFQEILSRLVLISQTVSMYTHNPCNYTLKVKGGQD